MSKNRIKKTDIREYLNLQGRFKHLDDNTIQEIQRNIDKEWNLLLQKERASNEEGAKTNG